MTKKLGVAVDIDTIAEHLLGLKQDTILIAVDGRSGAGKSTFAKYFAKELEKRNIQTDIVQTDNFYQKQETATAFPRHIVGYDFGYFWQKLRDQVLIPLKSGRRAAYTLSDWTTGEKSGLRIVEAKQVIVVEGVISTYKKLSDFFDLKIWLSCRRDARIERIIKRGDFPENELKEWQVIENDYVFGGHKTKADIIIDTSVDNNNSDNFVYKVRQINLPPAKIIV